METKDELVHLPVPYTLEWRDPADGERPRRRAAGGNVADGERYITLTSVSLPRVLEPERIIAYRVFDSFQPRADEAAGVPRGRRVMYAALWRVPPGPWWVRVLILLVAVAAILYGCSGTCSLV